MATKRISATRNESQKEAIYFLKELEGFWLHNYDGPLTENTVGNTY